MSTLRIAVIAGGPSTEAEVSRTGAREVRAALARAGHSPELLELDAELASRLRSERFDVVFPVTHGALGEDGCLQGLLEVLGLPYVGSGVLASALGASKPHAKALFQAAGLPVLAGRTVELGENIPARVPSLRAELGSALVVKPACGGSAIGVEIVAEEASDEAAARAIERVLEVEPLALVERFARGVEVTCGVLERGAAAEALSPTLIRPRAASHYDFISKYRAGGSEHVCPAPFGDGLVHAIQAAALTAHRALGCRDLSRTDFVVDESAGTFVVLEVNTLPGMTPLSLFPEAAAVRGIAFQVLCDELSRRAASRPRARAPQALPMP